MAKAKEPEDKVKRTVYLAPDLWRALRIQAIHEGRPATQIIQTLVEDYLAKVGKRRTP